MNICRVDEENHPSIIILIELKYYLKINRRRGRRTQFLSIVFRFPDIYLLLHEMIMYIVACSVFLHRRFYLAYFFIDANLSYLRLDCLTFSYRKL